MSTTAFSMEIKGTEVERRMRASRQVIIIGKMALSHLPIHALSKKKEKKSDQPVDQTNNKFIHYLHMIYGIKRMATLCLRFDIT